MDELTRRLPAIDGVGQQRATLAGEPLVFHCNHYNYWIQHTVRLDASLGMDPVIRDAAESCARGLLERGRSELGLRGPDAVLSLARDCFAELGFGMLDLSKASAEGGVVRTPVSHYGQTLASACSGHFERDQNLFDQGFAAAAVAVAFELEAGAFEVRNNRCMSRGADAGEFELVRRAGGGASPWPSPGIGVLGEGVPAARREDTHTDEGEILAALSGLDFSGNEEGLIPRFGVILTRHFANFYDRISFEFVERMRGSGMLDEAEELLVEAGRRCAYNTFGGIMLSGEWDAVIRSQCQTREDWAHGMVAVINALGWGCWRIIEIDERRAVIRVWDDYESTGWLGMYGGEGRRADRPVSYLAAGGAEGLMGLIYRGGIIDGPALDEGLYQRSCQGGVGYVCRQTRSLAQGDPYTELLVEAIE